MDSPYLKLRPLRISPAGSPAKARYRTVAMPPLVRKTERRTRLHFDIETRLVGFHKGGRFAPDGCEPIAMAWAWAGGPATVLSLKQQWRRADMLAMLKAFRSAYDEADMVTGHYILKFDLPVLNGAMLEFGLPPLSPKLAHDTKVHLFRRAAVSASQENLSLMRRIEEAKMRMADVDWREAARLTKPGIKKARDRVVTDVRQHYGLYGSLREGGYLRGPTVFRP